MKQASARRQRPPVANVIAFALLAALFSSACGGGSSPQAKVEAPPAPLQPVPSSQPQQIAKLPPQDHEVQEAVNRVFKGGAVIDTSSNPYFIAGDFNGDR